MRQYWRDKLPEKLLNAWKGVRPNSSMHLPRANPFVPTDMTMRWGSSSVGLVASANPMKILECDGFRVWHTQVLRCAERVHVRSITDTRLVRCSEYRITDFPFLELRSICGLPARVPLIPHLLQVP